MKHNKHIVNNRFISLFAIFTFPHLILTSSSFANFYIETNAQKSKIEFNQSKDVKNNDVFLKKKDNLPNSEIKIGYQFNNGFYLGGLYLPPHKINFNLEKNQTQSYSYNFEQNLPIVNHSSLKQNFNLETKSFVDVKLKNQSYGFYMGYQFNKDNLYFQPYLTLSLLKNKSNSTYSTHVNNITMSLDEETRLNNDKRIQEINMFLNNQNNVHMFNDDMRNYLEKLEKISKVTNLNDILNSDLISNTEKEKIKNKLNHIEKSIKQKTRDYNELSLGVEIGAKSFFTKNFYVNYGVNYHQLGKFSNVRLKQYGLKIGMGYFF